MVNRIVVGAHYGLRDWLVQRMTAVVMAVYVLLMVVILISNPSLDHAQWQALFANQWMRFASLLFLLSLYLHAWVGVRDIFMDYVKPVGVRLALQFLTVVALAFYAVWSVHILWGI